MVKHFWSAEVFQGAAFAAGDLLTEGAAITVPVPLSLIGNLAQHVALLAGEPFGSCSECGDGGPDRIRGDL